jgi:Cu-processing system permease protein
MKSLIKLEFLNIIRSRWFLFSILISTFLSYIGTLLFESFEKFLIFTSNFLIISCSIFVISFSGLYYYDNLNFWSLLISNGISRKNILFINFFLIFILFPLAFFLPCFIIGTINFNLKYEIFLLLLFLLITTAFFYPLGILPSISNKDKLKGFSISFLIWLFFVFGFDSFILAILIIFSDYPIDNLILILSSLNPIIVSRVFYLKIFGITENLSFVDKLINNFIFFSILFEVFLSIFMLIMLSKIISKKDF